MSEAVDPERTVGAALHLRLADSVVDTLNRIGERGTNEPFRVGNHIGDRRGAKLGLVEWQHEIGRERASSACCVAGLAFAAFSRFVSSRRLVLDFSATNRRSISVSTGSRSAVRVM